MKVAHVSTERGWRGGEQQLLYLASGLRERGVEQILFAREGSPLHERLSGAGIESEPFDARGGIDLPAGLRLGRGLRAHGCSHVHAHDAHAVVYAGLGGLRAGAKRLCTRRVDFPLRGGWLYRRLMQRVICISDAIARVCRRGGVPPERLAVVHSAVDPERLRGAYAKGPLCEEFGFDRRDEVLLNVASLTDHKDQATLLEAMLEIVRARPRAKLLIAGTGELEETLKRQARELALEHCVRFLGFREDLGALLHLCRVFVMSSHLEGLCTSVLDAMAMERPVVVTDAGGLPETVGDSQAGLVVPARDPQAFAGAVLEVLGDHRRREAMGRAARRRVLEAFTVERMVEGTLAEYRRLEGAPT